MNQSLEDILKESSSRHRHMCPRQVLGARMGLYAGELLGIALKSTAKPLLVITETDGCAVDGIIAATGCHVGARTLRIHDYGKIAASFIDIKKSTALRIAPSPNARGLAGAYVPDAANKWSAMMEGYKVIPPGELFRVQTIALKVPVAEIMSSRSRKAFCDDCGEEILNGREVTKDGRTLCGSCAGDRYYAVIL